LNPRSYTARPKNPQFFFHFLQIPKIKLSEPVILGFLPKPQTLGF